jgi:Citrate transporter
VQWESLLLRVGLVTPVVLALARQLDLDVALFAYTAVWLANTASLFLPVSNLTNLLALSALPRHNVRDFAVLTWPTAVTSVLITVLALAVIFRRSLRGRYQRLPAQPAAHRGLLVLGMIVCGALGPALLLGVNVVAASAVAAAILVVGCAIRARSLLTWRLLPWQLVLGVGLLFILVQIAHDRGLGAALQPSCRARFFRGGTGATLRGGRRRGEPGGQPAELPCPGASRRCLAATAGRPAGGCQRRTSHHALGEPRDPALGGPLSISRRCGVLEAFRRPRCGPRTVAPRDVGDVLVARARLTER